MSNHDTAYDFLQARHDEVEQLINYQAQHESETTSWTGLCFYSDDIAFVMPLAGAVQGIVPSQGITPMPKERDQWVGMRAYKDKVLPIINLQQIFWGHSAAIDQNSKIIVYKSDEVFWGILVNAVEGLRRFELNSQESVILDANVPYRQFVQHVCFQHDQRYAILNMENLINSISEERE